MLEQTLPQLKVDREDECPSCGHQGLIIGTSLWEEVYQCHHCRLCFLKKSVRPKSANDNNWYEDIKNCPQNMVDYFVNCMKQPYSRQLAVLEKLTRGRKILDLGCGIGIFLSVAKSKNWDVFGVDESSHATFFASKNFDIQYSHSLDEFADNEFDVIRMSHVLEHIPEPKEVLTKINRILKPGGILAIIVPNCEPLCASIVNRIRHLWSDKPKLACAVFPDMHVLGFSVESLSNLVYSMGFNPQEIFTVSMGNRTYYPMFYDGLLTIKKIHDIPTKQLLKFYLPMVIDNLGDRLQRGQWVVGYFQKN